jgi:hypothetical protein
MLDNIAVLRGSSSSGCVVATGGMRFFSFSGHYNAVNDPQEPCHYRYHHENIRFQWLAAQGL